MSVDCYQFYLWSIGELSPRNIETHRQLIQDFFHNYHREDNSND
jgi:hypothetical protein